MVILQTNGCCAISEITKLSKHKNPIEALEAFCAFYAGIKPQRRLMLHDMADYYLFSGVVAERGTETDHDEEAGFVTDTTYGPNFANFIVSKRLGTIVQAPQRINTNHPLHTVQAWLWSPNREKLSQWWHERVKAGKVRM